MRLRNIPGARQKIKESEYVIADPTDTAGTWGEIFGNDNPIHIEIGMGKGKFITTMAMNNPEINYLGIEKYSSVLLKAKNKQDELGLDNLRLVRMDAEGIDSVFGENEVSKIYLNFSDPWPKDRHAKRRLPSRWFLNRYEKILEPGSVIEFKTDNVDLFDFALEEAKESGWSILECTYDLHSDERLSAGNVMTEYEEKFSGMGNKICKLIINKNA